MHLIRCKIRFSLTKIYAILNVTLDNFNFTTSENKNVSFGVRLRPISHYVFAFSVKLTITFNVILVFFWCVDLGLK